MDLLDRETPRKPPQHRLHSLWQPGDAVTDRAGAWNALSADDLPLPGKFGFAVDCRPERHAAKVFGRYPDRARGDRVLICGDDGAQAAAPWRSRPQRRGADLARWFLRPGGASMGTWQDGVPDRGARAAPASRSLRAAPGPRSKPGMTASARLWRWHSARSRAEAFARLADLARCV